MPTPAGACSHVAPPWRPVVPPWRTETWNATALDVAVKSWKARKAKGKAKGKGEVGHEELSQEEVGHKEQSQEVGHEEPSQEVGHKEPRQEEVGREEPSQKEAKRQCAYWAYPRESQKEAKRQCVSNWTYPRESRTANDQRIIDLVLSQLEGTGGPA